MAPFVPPADYVIHETDHWWVNHRCDTQYPGYLMLGAKDPVAGTLSKLSPEAAAEMGVLLSEMTRALEDVMKPLRIYTGRYGHQPGHTVHFHIIPVYDWTVSAYWQDDRYRSLQQFYGSGEITSNPDDFDGADMTLFIWRTFAEKGMAPPKIDGPGVKEIVSLLREAFSRRGNP